MSTLDRGVTPENGRRTSFGVVDIRQVYNRRVSERKLYNNIVSNFLEAIVLFLPTDAGGRATAIAPREGSYRPTVGSTPMRFIEGPPIIAPGQAARVVVEIEESADLLHLTAGTELEIVEQERVVGILTVTRLCRAIAV